MELTILTGLALCLVGLSGEARLTMWRLTKEEPGRKEPTKEPPLLASERPDLGSREGMLRPVLERKHRAKAMEEETVPPGAGHLKVRKTPKGGAHSHGELSQAPRSSGKSPARNHKKGLSRRKIHTLRLREQEAKPIYLKPEMGKKREGKVEPLPPAINQSRKNKTLPLEVTGLKEERKSRKLGGGDSKKADLKRQEAKKTIKAVTWRLQQKAEGWGQNTRDLETNWKKSGPSRGDTPLLLRPIIFPSLGPTEEIIPSLPAMCHLSEASISCGNAKMKVIPPLSDPGLKTLYLSENEISKIPAETFNGVPNLEWLDLSKNKLDTQGLHPDAFKNLTRLKRLNLDGNSLSAIPELPSSLQELKVNDNTLRGLQRTSFRGLAKLLTLEAEGNQLHDGNIYPLAFQPLKSLMYLRLNRNHLRGIPQGLPASLQELHLDSNHIEEISERVLNKSRSLSLLVLSNNRIQEDHIAPRAWIDLPKLESLDLSHNRLVHVPSFLPRGLRRLMLHHNRIERIPGYVFAHMKPGLEFLHLSYNSLQDDGIHSVSFLGLRWSLAELLLDNNQLQAIPRGILGLKGLQVLRLSHNKIRHVPLNSVCDTRVAQDSNLISMHLENNLIDRRRIPPTAFSCIKAYESVVLKPQQDEEEY
ncbi:extracellular matrix protein 2-like [Dromiciops gliroides]|uniref:extracellular matrix protein 2-like n=1 Tax=Dromiciops gliroides TaxID=33562 RepID=UPI001CC6232B|nr:extracellular matrix protein 2-like [Dromiciops gliroides]